MKKKNNLIILGSVLAVCIVGVLLSQFIGWPVDSGNTGGDIGKSSRFSRKVDTEAITNMEELLANDENYKNGVVSAYAVMSTRAQQFGALVDMSNEVAGKLPPFGDVLKAMNDARPMIDNVCASLLDAGSDLDAALSGEQRPDLAQNTINASLAYTTLQKQNELANRFIATTDEYLKTAEGDDRLMLVRDQWVDYQRMSAALDGDEQAAQTLAAKGYLLSPDRSLSALESFDESSRLAILCSADLANTLGRDSQVDINSAEATAAVSEILDGDLAFFESARLPLFFFNSETLGSHFPIRHPNTITLSNVETAFNAVASQSGNLAGVAQSEVLANNLGAIIRETATGNLASETVLNWWWY